MPRYFFNVVDGREIRDELGTELPSLDAAREEALQASVELLRALKRKSEFWAGDAWIMNVTDEAGRAVLTLRFSGQSHH